MSVRRDIENQTKSQKEPKGTSRNEKCNIQNGISLDKLNTLNTEEENQLI